MPAITIMNKKYLLSWLAGQSGGVLHASPVLVEQVVFSYPLIPVILNVDGNPDLMLVIKFPHSSSGTIFWAWTQSQYTLLLTVNNTQNIHQYINYLLYNIFQATHFLWQCHHKILEVFFCQQNDLSFSLVHDTLSMDFPQSLWKVRSNNNIVLYH